MNPSSIQCPQCKSDFDISEVMRKELQQAIKEEMNKEAAEWKRKQLEELNKQKEQWQKLSSEAETRWQQEKQAIEQQQAEAKAAREKAAKEQEQALELLKTELAQTELQRSKAIAEAEARLETALQQQHAQKLADERQKMILAAKEECQNELLLEKEKAQSAEEKLKQAREKELSFLRREELLKKQASEAEYEMKRQLMAERERLAAELKDEELKKREHLETEHKLQLRALEEKLQQQIVAAEEMKRKAEQGSMQLQGEVLELILQEELGRIYPFDRIAEVAKGVRGADCIQTVNTQYGQCAGKIIYETKRTGAFNKEWIDKLKMDMASQGADIAVIVTQTMPVDMPRFGQRDGVYICSFQEVKSVSLVLRNALLQCHDVRSASTNKADKMSQLYDYLTSTEFGLQWKMVSEVFMQLRQQIVQEKAAMEKLWKAREKQLDKALSGAVQIQGSIEGIAGQSQIGFALAPELDAAYEGDPS